MSRHTTPNSDADRTADETNPTQCANRGADAPQTLGQSPESGTDPTERADRVPHVEAGKDLIRSRLAHADGLFLCLDFDGTLAPIESDPDTPALTPENRAAIAALRDQPGVSVAVVSGRGLDDLVERVDLPGLDYAGNHGLELAVDGERTVHPIAAKRLPKLRRIRAELATRLAPIPGCELEDKRLSLSVHVRGATPADADLACRRTANVVETLGGDEFRLETGKSVLEVLPAVPVGKDHAVRVLRMGSRADALPVFVGDDTSDEAAFEEVCTDGVAVHVGPGRDTTAEFRVDGPDDVAAFLRWLHGAHRGARATSTP